MNSKLDYIQYLLDKYPGNAMLSNPDDTYSFLVIKGEEFMINVHQQTVDINETVDWFHAKLLYIAIQGSHANENAYDGQRYTKESGWFTWYRVE